jgi:hypothetical protein
MGVKTGEVVVEGMFTYGSARAEALNQWNDFVLRPMIERGSVTVVEQQLEAFNVRGFQARVVVEPSGVVPRFEFAD